MKPLRLVCLAAAGAALLAGCGGEAAPLDITLIHKDCVGKSFDYFSGSYTAGTAHVKITGPGIDPPVEEDVNLSRSAQFKNLVPYGDGRMVEVTLYHDATKKMQVGFGSAGPINVKQERVPEVRVVTYPLYDSVRGVKAGTGECSQLVTGRAGFSIALLPDGRVLVAGGYTAGGPEKPDKLTDTAEIIDPRTGEVKAVAKMCPNGDSSLCSPRAYAPAVVLPDGRVLIAGGLTKAEDGGPDSGGALFYDYKTNKWTSAAMIRSRRYNTATALWTRPNKVLITGGISGKNDPAGSNEILDSTEIFDAKTNTFTEGDKLDQPVARHGAAYFSSGHAVGIAGGLTKSDTGVAVSNMLMAFTPDTGARASGSGGPNPGGLDGSGVVGATVTTLGNQLLIFGGSTSWTSSTNDIPGEGSITPTSIYAGWQTWEGSGSASPHKDPPATTALGCGVYLDQNRSWVGGGLNATLTPVEEMRFANLTGVASVSTVVKPGVSVAQTLEDRRIEPGCVALNDHQIVIVGGWGNTRNSQPRALPSIEVLTVGKLSTSSMQ